MSKEQKRELGYYWCSIIGSPELRILNYTYCYSGADPDNKEKYYYGFDGGNSENDLLEDDEVKIFSEKLNLPDVKE